jgi:hypothetical protein
MRLFAGWLRGSRLGRRDMVLVFSVGGGDVERNVSGSIVRAREHAREVGATICGVVGHVVGCDVITVTPALLWKLRVVGKNLREYSRERVQMLYDDGQKAGHAR